jgi:serine O-acetyltransferase
MFKNLKEDIQAFMDRDPAAHSMLEVFLCYPGYHALIFYRLSHWLWGSKYRIFARFVSHIGKILTGVEIHPGATIGDRFVIDHATGVVIGETSIIGDDVTIYQGVTLGGIAPSIDSDAQIGQKRHPTIENGAVIGSGAAILGPIVIGECVKIGANSVVTKAIPAGMTAVGIPARIIMPKNKAKSKDFVAYGTIVDGPDPVVQTIDALRREMKDMVNRVHDLEHQLADKTENSKNLKKSNTPTKPGKSTKSVVSKKSKIGPKKQKAG